MIRSSFFYIFAHLVFVMGLFLRVGRARKTTAPAPADLLMERGRHKKGGD